MGNENSIIASLPEAFKNKLIEVLIYGLIGTGFIGGSGILRTGKFTDTMAVEMEHRILDKHAEDHAEMRQAMALITADHARLVEKVKEANAHVREHDRNSREWKNRIIQLENRK